MGVFEMYRCGICGQRWIVRRPPHKARKNNHEKHIWCVKCKRRTRHFKIDLKG